MTGGTSPAAPAAPGSALTGEEGPGAPSPAPSPSPDSTAGAAGTTALARLDSMPATGSGSGLSGEPGGGTADPPVLEGRIVTPPGPPPPRSAAPPAGGGRRGPLDSVPVTTVLERAEEGGGPELTHLVAGWLLAYSSPHTRDAYARDLAEWLDFLAAPGGRDGAARRDPLGVKRGDADAYARTLEQRGASSATVRRKLAAVSSFYTYAEEEEAVQRNRVRRATKPPRSDGGKTGALSQAQTKALLRAADRMVADASAALAARPDSRRRANRLLYALRARALVYLLAGLGIRASEARTLRLSDLDEHDGHRRARVTVKGGKEHFRPVPARLEQVLGEYLAVSGHHRRPGGPLLATATGRPLARSETGRILNQVAELARLKVHPHKLRATFVTLALAQGEEIETVRRAVAHATRAQTEAYNDTDRDLQNDPATLIVELVSPRRPQTARAQRGESV
ncbi:tyrosine-type recombinase/integrase [Actinomadura sp. NPDC048394]|uniref:tyrosine-type recombinase/integrase n=1 Tax=Actinomadura sp. NPDC048394 TaxID=3158223 RepID=UPI00340B0D71